MNTPKKHNSVLLKAILGACLLAAATRAQEVTTKFFYQGQLLQGGNPVSGNFDLQFTLLNANGNQMAVPLTLTGIGVSQGVLAVALDFGRDPFTPPAAQSLAVAVRPSGGTEAFLPLNPPQPIGAAPYAITAANLAGPLPPAQLPSTVPSLNAANIFSANQSLDGTSSLYFGTELRQSLNLYGESYGIGVQPNTMFFRAGPGSVDGFGWYRGGKFENSPYSPGGGDLFMKLDSAGLDVSASVQAAKLSIKGDAQVKTLTITGGADLAEPFQISHANTEKGSLMVIDEAHPGQLKLSSEAYDTRVAGVISGANGIEPGLSLRQSGVIEAGQNVALSGRVYVKATASNGPITPGDLLTTSSTPGHAMKVTDPTRSHGAVVGKAMSALDQDRGFVLVLVSLQ